MCRAMRIALRFAYQILDEAFVGDVGDISNRWHSFYSGTIPNFFSGRQFSLAVSVSRNTLRVIVLSGKGFV